MTKIGNYGHPQSEKTRQKIRNALSGRRASPEAIKKNKESHIGLLLSEGAKKKISMANRGERNGMAKNKGEKHFAFGKKFSDKHRENLKIGHSLTYKKILLEIDNLEKEGFRCVPIGRVIPDIVAIKGNKIYAIEVEYGFYPNYKKYNKENYKKYFDDIIWIKKHKYIND
jgi:hypothetical protein